MLGVISFGLIIPFNSIELLLSLKSKLVVSVRVNVAVILFATTFPSRTLFSRWTFSSSYSALSSFTILGKLPPENVTE